MSQTRHTTLGIHAQREQGAPSGRRGPIYRRTKWVAVAILAVLVLGAARIVIVRVVHARELQAATANEAKRYVATVHAQPSAVAQTVTLPGTLQGFIESPIY